MKTMIAGAALLLLSAYASALTPPDPALVGCWHSDTVTSYLSDGTTRDGKAECTLVYSDSEIRSECMGTKGPFSITYSYEVIAPGKYEAEIKTHSALPKAVGSKREYEYRVEKDKLSITTFPQRTPMPLNAAIKVVSTSTRDSGSCTIAK